MARRNLGSSGAGILGTDLLGWRVGDLMFLVVLCPFLRLSGVLGGDLPAVNLPLLSLAGVPLRPRACSRLIILPFEWLLLGDLWRKVVDLLL